VGREEAKLTEFHGIPSFLELNKHLHINPLNSVPVKWYVTWVHMRLQLKSRSMQD